MHTHEVGIRYLTAFSASGKALTVAWGAPRQLGRFISGCDYLETVYAVTTDKGERNCRFDYTFVDLFISLHLIDDQSFQGLFYFDDLNMSRSNPSDGFESMAWNVVMMF